MNQPLGFGLTRPFRRDERDFAAAGGEQLIRSAVGQILGTIASSEGSTGEVPWRPEMGSLLPILCHRRNGPVLQELARVYVVEALARWEPRVVVRAVAIEANGAGDPSVLAIRVRYDIATSRGGAALAGDLEERVHVTPNEPR
jgi:uncharacterized protein